MPTWYDNYWANLTSTIMAAWPEITGYWQDNAIERQDWTNLLNDDQLGVPWCVVKLSTSAGDLGVPYPHVLISAEIVYIDGLAAAAAASEESGNQVPAAQWIMDKLQALWAAIQPSEILGTVRDDVTYNESADLPHNDVFLANGFSYMAASLTINSYAITADIP